MCPTSRSGSRSRSETGSDEPEHCYDWLHDSVNGGSLRHVDLDTGSNGWASPPGDLFHLRGKNYLSNRRQKEKLPAGPYLLRPAGVDWLRSTTRLDHVLSRPDNRIASNLRRAHSFNLSLKSFIFAVNIQIPGRDHCHSSVFYFATEDPIPPGSLLYRFINGDDNFRNSRFKLVNRIVKGPWIVKAAVGNYAACLLGKALTCHYHRGENYLEIDVDMSSSAIANAVLHLALGYVTAVTVDMGFVIEGQTEEELPEKLIGAVRIAQMEMGSATYVDSTAGGGGKSGGNIARVNNHQGGREFNMVSEQPRFESSQLIPDVFSATQNEYVQLSVTINSRRISCYPKWVWPALHPIYGCST